MTFGSFPISADVYLLSYGLSFALSLGFTLFILHVVSRANFLTQFLNRLPISAGKVVSPFGGIPVIFSFLITLWVLYFSGMVNPGNLDLFVVLTLGMGLMFGLGIIDDIYHISPKAKIAWQIVIAVALYFAGFQIERIGGLMELGQFSILLTILWIVGITNALNLIDGIDGLAGGVVFLACLTLTFVYLERYIPEASFTSVILGGSVFGFLLFNFPPAKIILGDAGSLPLGLMISLITLLPLNQGHTDEIYYLIPIITLLIPITDTTLAVFRRLSKGINRFLRDVEHIHHRLNKLGLSPLKSIFILFAVCLYFDLTALIPVYHVSLIPKFIPVYSTFILINIAVLIFLLKRFEKLKRHE